MGGTVSGRPAGLGAARDGPRATIRSPTRGGVEDPPETGISVDIEQYRKPQDKERKMNAKATRGKGLVSLLFAVALALGMMPATALAANDSLPPETGNLHIHKYLGDGSVIPGAPNDGTQMQTPPDPDDWKPLGNIKFDIYKVDADANGDYPGTKPYRLSVDGTTLTDGENHSFTVAPVAASPVTTDSAGEATASNLSQGVYLVVERADSRVTTPADPFVVAVPMTNADNNGWITDVHVYPKNFNLSAVKEIKSPAGSEQTGSAVNVGDLVTYSIVPTVPGDVVAYKVDPNTGRPAVPLAIDTAEDANIKYSVTDVLADALTFVDAAPDNLKVYGLAAGEDPHAGGTLIARTDNYTVDRSGVTVNFTPDGRKLLYVGSGTEAAPVPYASIRIELSATVNANILDTTKYPGFVVGNTAQADFTNRWHQTADPTKTNTVEVHAAALDITKKDQTSGRTLEGAEFKIADSLQNAQDGKYLKVLPSDHPTRPNAIVDPADPDYGAKGAEDWLEASDSNGKILFDGIEDYTSVMNADGSESKTPAHYWLVETKAPEGFNLPADPFEFVFDGSEVGHVLVKDINNTNEFVLPLTGGAGTLLLTVVGVALVGGGAIALAMSRKKKAADK